MARKPDDTINLRVRLPETMRKMLETQAEMNERSLNSEIVYRLGQSLGAEDLARQHESADQRIRRILDEFVQRQRKGDK